MEIKTKGEENILQIIKPIFFHDKFDVCKSIMDSSYPIELKIYRLHRGRYIYYNLYYILGSSSRMQTRSPIQIMLNLAGMMQSADLISITGPPGRVLLDC
jgi:hypothetical protein